MSKECPFCKVTKNYHNDKRVINGDKNFVVINSKYPVTPRGHLLVIPYEHVTDSDFYNVKESKYSTYLSWINYGIEILKERGFTSFNVGWNLGIKAGQTIEHQHCHIIGRRKGDVEDPRGGIRNVIPAKGNYLK